MENGKIKNQDIVLQTLCVVFVILRVINYLITALTAEQEWTVLLMADPMTMSRLKAYRRNASAIEDIKAELSGKYVADSISVCTPPSYTPHSTRIDGFLPNGDTLSLLCEQARLEREQRAVEEFIKGIGDRQMRKIFVLRFVKGFTWIQIGHKVGGTADGCRMAVKRYLKK